MQEKRCLRGSPKTNHVATRAHGLSNSSKCRCRWQESPEAKGKEEEQSDRLDCKLAQALVFLERAEVSRPSTSLSPYKRAPPKSRPSGILRHEPFPSGRREKSLQRIDRIFPSVAGSGNCIR